ncbi:putative phage protein (TIGR02218 family) [Herbaspirillum sp. Sphag1AN]|uniref:phage BR0599 family protein n=1 Tax=unclassified Herbaspirillum TaxID=2624150 RepID=UPI00160C2580|nr:MULTISPECIES: phage BR0599 family protein [unclassified Herbaspirillum]MBB3211665.1 putative phage protein (TIGR02218 family) [Herbaspirillum sp. Sphag1AN]MBB3245067.1 putative phage protein (TIGR02218 family) [Herbaspirillum sp. Sphag64]
MSYADKEASVDGGHPVELFEFRRGGNSWCYTSAAQDTSYASSRYLAIPMKRGSIDQSGEMGRAGLRISMTRDAEIVRTFIATPPSEVTLLTIYRLHRHDAEAIAVWMGRVLNVEWRGSEAEMNCEPVYTSLQRTGLRRLYQRNCPHVLYGTSCQVSSVIVRLPAKVAGIEGVVLNVPSAAGYPEGHFAGGFATWAASGLTEKRMIVAHTRDLITLSTVPPSLTSGDSILLYPGCDHTLSTCDAKFGNSANFGGFPFIPPKNPFGGGSVY